MPSAKHDSRWALGTCAVWDSPPRRLCVRCRVKTFMLSEFIATNRQEIIGRCRAKVATRPAAPRTKPETDHGVPVFLDQLVTALRLRLTSHAAITTSAVF